LGRRERPARVSRRAGAIPRRGAWTASEATDMMTQLGSTGENTRGDKGTAKAARNRVR
jgi:hypothetical protein